MRVPVWVIREKFNKGGYEQQVASGELTTMLLADTHPSPPRAPEPICTRSQEIGYFDNDRRKIAQVHQYLRPDGTLGASGMPDPKRLKEGDVLYIADPDEELYPPSQSKA